MNWLSGRRRLIPAGVGLAAIAAVVLFTADSQPSKRTEPGGPAVATEVLAANVTAEPSEPAPVTTPDTPSLSATPTTGLTDKQTIHVTGDGFAGLVNIAVLQCTPSPAGFADCATDTIAQHRSDAAGDLLMSHRVDRVIRTESSGRVDCGSTGCVLAIATLGPVEFTTVPIGFAEIAESPVPFRIELTDGHWLDQSGEATIRARLHCDRDLDGLVISFDVTQTDPAARGSDRLAVDCNAGSETTIFSDLLTGLSVGTANARVTVSSPDGDTGDAGTIDLVGAETVIARLRARLADPTDTTVADEFVGALRFRLDHNPRFAQRFIAAILRSTPRS